MTAASVLRLYLIALPTFLVIDALWLGVLARSFYQAQLGHLMRPQVNWLAATAFYLVFVLGIVVLAVWPAIERQSLGHAILLGAQLVAYAAYDLTNLAVLDGFPIVVALVDMAWGAILCASVSAVSYVLGARLT